jgi:hypothetical protein
VAPCPALDAPDRSALPLAGAELAQSRKRNELRHVLDREHLPTGREQELLHVLPADAETTAGDAGDDLELRLVRRLSEQAERAQMLDARDLVAGRAIVLGQFGLDDDLGIDLVGDDEVRGLIEARQPLGAFRLAEADALSAQDILDRIFDDVPDELADRILGPSA